MSTEQSTKARRKITKRLVDGLAAGQTVWDVELTGFGVRRQCRDASFVLKYLFRGRARAIVKGGRGVATRALAVLSDRSLVQAAQARAKVSSDAIAAATA